MMRLRQAQAKAIRTNQSKSWKWDMWALRGSTWSHLVQMYSVTNGALQLRQLKDFRTVRSAPATDDSLLRLAGILRLISRVASMKAVFLWSIVGEVKKNLLFVDDDARSQARSAPVRAVCPMEFR